MYQAAAISSRRDDFGECMKKILYLIETRISVIKEDVYLHDYIEYLKDLIHSGTLVKTVEEVVGSLY